MGFAAARIQGVTGGDREGNFIRETKSTRPFSQVITLFYMASPNPPSAVNVTAVDGSPVPISSLWKDRKIVLIFLRQLGCRFCRQVSRPWSRAFLRCLFQV